MAPETERILQNRSEYNVSSNTVGTPEGGNEGKREKESRKRGPRVEEVYDQDGGWPWREKGGGCTKDNGLGSMCYLESSDEGPVVGIQEEFVYRVGGEEQLVEVSSMVYKKVANKVRPVATTLPEEYWIVRRMPHNPLEDLPVVDPDPPPFQPGKRYTQERKDAMGLSPDGFLTEDEQNIIHQIILTHENAFAWTEAEKGKFSDEYFEPVLIPTVEHVPWVNKNIPILPGIFNEVTRILKEKIAAGVYEPSNSSYRSRWFCVLKKDGKSLRLVHDLQPLNQVAIKDAGVVPMVEHLAESFGGRACYSLFDLYVAFDQRSLDRRSRDLTTFQSPAGTLRATVVPMGYTNAVQVIHGDVTYILQDEIPHVTMPYVDDVPAKGPKTRYEREDGTYETLPGRPTIRRFVWEHLQDVNRIIHRIKKAGATFLGKKAFVCVPEAIIVGHRCTYVGREPDESKVAKIKAWPRCETVTQV